jgi:uncharacterized protein YbbC (DUF1343 family)
VIVALLLQVLTGLERIDRDGFASLKADRVGLLVNHTSVDRRGRHLVDLALAAGVKVTALFSPEHGIRGAADAEVASGRDAKTGLPVHSLYGKTKKPTAEMLREVDVVVFDLQDIGARYYTYISTLGLLLEAAKEHGKRVVVLDRPNPIGGDAVEGPIQDPELVGQFISWFPMPTRHGMTVGEIAGLFAEHLGAKVEVVRMDGWKRPMFLDETGVPWVNPSPNMRSLEAALAYPGLGALEGTNLSVGRGTGRAFRLYGAPWVDGEKLCAELAARNLPGVRFKPAVFTPRLEPGFPKYPHTDEECRGFEVEIADRRAFRPVSAALHVLDVLRRLHPDRLKIGRAATMIGKASIEADLAAGKSPAEIERGWQAELDRFREVRAKHLSYR